MALAGCQGGGSNPPPFNTGNPPPSSATQSASLTPSGGSVTTTLGTQTVKVIVPPGALSGPGTVSLTVYANGNGPKPLQSAARKVQTLGGSPVLVIEFSVAVTGATLLSPLQASLTTPAAAGGSVFRLAGFGTAFDDIDTVTFAAGAATSDLNIKYPRMSLATPPGGTVYAFYTTATPTAAPAPVITLAPSAALPIGILGTATFTASEASPNGFPYLDTKFAFALLGPNGTTPADGTFGTLDPNTGAFTAGSLDGSGTVQATDTTAGRGSPSGKGPVSVTSQRPGNLSDSFTFKGTLSSVTQQINSNFTSQPQTDSANVDLVSTVSAVQVFPGQGVGTIVHSNETDTYPIRTIKTATDNTVAYANGPGAHATVALLKTDSKDSNASEYITDYTSSNLGNGILDVIPESTGPFGPNNATLHYTELDPANFSRDRVVSANGSYVEHDKDAFGDDQSVTVSSDLSAFLNANQYSGFNFTFGKPTATNPSTITFQIRRGNGAPATRTIPSWIPAGTTQPSTETDVNNGSVAYAAACNVPAKYGTSGTQLVQTINRVDPAFGNLETLTTTTWVSNGVGPVCIQMTDSVGTFYDFTGQNGNFALFFSNNTKPIQLTTISETLTLQSALVQNGKVAASTKRGTSSITSSAFAPAAVARARFERTVREKLDAIHKQNLNRNLTSNGVQAL